MNLLVVGNGFDLAHGLPTKYSDFLDFLVLYINDNNLWEIDNITKIRKNDSEILLQLKNSATKNVPINNILVNCKQTIHKFETTEFKTTIKYNDWIRYFLYVYFYRQKFSNKYNWVDLESEILSLLKCLQEQKVSSFEALRNINIQISPSKRFSLEEDDKIVFHILEPSLQEEDYATIPITDLKKNCSRNYLNN